MKRYLICFLLVLCTLRAQDSPTASFLKAYPLEKIERVVKKQTKGKFDSKKWFPFLLDAASQEEPGFFGYHATSSSHFLIHHVLKTTFDELYGIHIPEDFYLLRPPVDSCYLLSGKSEFLRRFAVPQMSQKKQKKLISLLLLKPLEKATKLKLPLSGIREEYFEKLQLALMHFFSESGPRPPITREEAIDVLKMVFQDHPQKKLLYAKLEKWFRHPEKHFVIKTDSIQVKEKINKKELKNYIFLYKTVNPIQDTEGDMQKILLSMNVALFAHFSCMGESTMHVVASNKSIELDGQKLSKKILGDFFTRIGYGKDIVNELLEAMKKAFPANDGVLLQFFDTTLQSDSPMLDRFAYVSEAFGKPIFAYKASDFLKNFDPKNKLAKMGKGKKLMVLHPQLRLVMTSRETLNPFSFLRIKIYHSISKEALLSFSELVRAKLRSHASDPDKVQAYGKDLQELWGIQPNFK